VRRGIQTIGEKGLNEAHAIVSDFTEALTYCVFPVDLVSRFALVFALITHFPHSYRDLVRLG
jgi:hypothetical protein